MDEIIKAVDKKKKSIEHDAIVDAITPVIPDNCIVAKGFFNTVKGAVKPGDVVCVEDLIGSLIDLEKAGLA